MYPSIFIVHRNDGLLRAIVRLLVDEHYVVHTADGIAAIERQLAAAGRPALLLVDDDAAGPRWREQLERIAGDVPTVLLTFDPSGPFPPNVVPVAKPFRARDLLEVVSRGIAGPSPRPLPG